MTDDGTALEHPEDLPWRLALRVHHPSADLSDVAKRVRDVFGVPGM